MIRRQYDNFGGRKTALRCLDPSLAVQDARDESDINTIVRRFGVSGQLPQGVRVPTYGDFEVVVDFQTAQNALVAARESFMAMPADVRSRFNNDAGEFVDFCSDSSNLDEMRKMGLAVPEVIPDEAVKPLEVKATAKPEAEKPKA